MKLFGKKPAPEKLRSTAVGEWGEQVASAALKRAGYTLLGHNIRPNKHDEIDIVARTGETLVFVEVKTRGSEDFGRPATAIKSEKRHALNRAAAAYLRKANYPDLYYRFDVVEVVGQPEDKEPVVTHVENAFPFERRFKFPAGRGRCR
ncbi:MAG: YraN family protein [Kiritimatiellae bacterium]|nr:YraN family protein [Kiritimatiellia bacterium]